MSELQLRIKNGAMHRASLVSITVAVKRQETLTGLGGALSFASARQTYLSFDKKNSDKIKTWLASSPAEAN